MVPVTVMTRMWTRKCGSWRRSLSKLSNAVSILWYCCHGYEDKHQNIKWLLCSLHTRPPKAYNISYADKKDWARDGSGWLDVYHCSVLTRGGIVNLVSVSLIKLLPGSSHVFRFFCLIKVAVTFEMSSSFFSLFFLLILDLVTCINFIFVSSSNSSEPTAWETLLLNLVSFNQNFSQMNAIIFHGWGSE